MAHQAVTLARNASLDPAGRSDLEALFNARFGLQLRHFAAEPLTALSSDGALRAAMACLMARRLVRTGASKGNGPMTQGLGGIQQSQRATVAILTRSWQNQRHPKARTTAVQGAWTLVQFQPPAMGLRHSGDQG